VVAVAAVGVLRLVVLLPVGVGLVVLLELTVALEPQTQEVEVVAVEITQEVAVQAAQVLSLSKCLTMWEQYFLAA